MNAGKYTILFVCSGNSCRSPMAEGLMKAMIPDELRESVIVKSAGTLGLDGHPATLYAVTTAEELGADISEHRSQGLTQELVDEANIVFAMASNHKKYFEENFPEAKENIFLLKQFDRDKTETADIDIEDPIGRSLKIYRECGREIDEELKRILPRLLELIKATLGKS